jgi:hypothetical protein
VESTRGIGESSQRQKENKRRNSGGKQEGGEGRKEQNRKEKESKEKKRKEKDLKAEHDAATAMAILYYALSALFYYLRARHQRCFHIAF